MKKLLMVSGSLPPIRCGVGFYTHRLLENLVGLDIDLDILTSEGITKDFKNSNYYTTPDWRIRRIIRLVREVKKSKPGIIHIQYPTVPYKRQLGINLLPLAVRLFVPKAKVLITLHEYYGSSWLGRIRSLVSLWPAKSIIVSNEADRRSLPANLRKRVTIIPIASNLEKAARNQSFYHKLLAKNGLEPSRPTLMFFGFAYPNKGLENLIGAMAQAPLTNWQLLLLTSLSKDNLYHRRLLEMIRQINSRLKRVAVAGYLPDQQVSELLQEGKYFVFPQNTPLIAKSSTALAAVQHKLVLVSKASSDPGLQQPFTNLKNCYLLKTVTPQSIAKAIGELEESDDKVKAILQGSNELNSYFSWSKITKDHFKLYESL